MTKLSDRIPYLNIVKILAPLIGVGLLYFGVRWALNDSYNKGQQSRDVEITELNRLLKVSALDLSTLKADVSRCKKARTIADNQVINLQGKLLAQADETAKAAFLQSQQFASTQATTNRAMETLARNTKATDLDFVAILEQLKGVHYDFDQDTGHCVIRGGGRLLRDAAKGRVGN